MVSNSLIVRRWFADIMGDTASPRAYQDLVDRLPDCPDPIQMSREFLRTPPVIDRIVFLLHRYILDREPGHAGLSYWAAEYVRHHNVLTCAATLLASDEFFEEQTGQSVTFFQARLLSILTATDLRLEVPITGDLSQAGNRFAFVEATLARRAVRLRLSTSLAFLLGLAHVGAAAIAEIASMVEETGFIENVLVKLLTHPAYLKQADLGHTASDIHQSRIAALMTNLQTSPSQIADLSYPAIRADVSRRFPRWNELHAYLVLTLDRPDLFAKLLTCWVDVGKFDGAKTSPSTFDASAQGTSTTATSAAAPTTRAFTAAALHRTAFLLLSDLVPYLETTAPGTASTLTPQARSAAAIDDTAHIAALVEVATPIVERWLDLYGQFILSVDWTPEDVVCQWAKRLAENEGILLIFCEFLLSPVCSGVDLARLSGDAAPISHPPGCFVLKEVLARPGKMKPLAAEPLLATSYFYWYDNQGAKEFIVCPDTLARDDGQDSLTLRPADEARFSFHLFEWHSRQLTDMVEAGINVVLPVTMVHPNSDAAQWNAATSRGVHVRLGFADTGLRVLRRSWLDLLYKNLPVPMVAMFFDTSTLNRVNIHGLKIDFRRRFSFAWFYETIRNFFSHFPRPMWALHDDRPIVFVYHPCFGDHVNYTLYPYVRRRFAEDFGGDLFIVTAAEEEAPRVLRSQDLRCWAERLHRKRAGKVLAEFLSRDEAYAACGNTDRLYVTNLMARLLARIPSEQEIAVHLGILHRGGKRSLVDRLLASDSFFTSQLARWFRRFLRTDVDADRLDHNELINRLRRPLAERGDWIDALSEIFASPLAIAAAGGTDEYLADWIYQSLVWKHPNPHCPNGSNNSTDVAGRTELVANLRTKPRQRTIRAFLDRYEVREAIVSGWFFDFYGWFNPGRADASFYWCAAISPVIREVASIGPGYDQSKLTKRPPLVMPRRDGRTYEEAWKWVLAMDPRPQIIHLETWNEFFEGSCICETAEYGRKYIEMTRRFACDYFRPKAAPH